MLRALRFILIAAVLLVVVWLIGTIPGTVTAQSGDATVQTSVPVAILILVVIALALTALFRLLGRIRRAPRDARAWREARRRSAGEDAVLRGMVALAAGDAASASAEAGRAEKALGGAPLALWLKAEAHRIAGRSEQAAAVLKDVAAHRQLGFLGHHAALRAALDDSDFPAAEAAAAAGERLYPGAPSLRAAKLQLAIKRQDWKAALSETADRPAIAAFAAAAAGQTTNRREAFALAKHAVKLDPALAPAVSAYARALRATGRHRAARRALRAAWAARPQPLIAAAWLEPFTAPIERAREAAILAEANPADPESAILLAQTALAADLTGEARRHATAALAAGGDDQRVRRVLAALDNTAAAHQAVATAKAPSWFCRACGAQQGEWSPVCASCERPASLSWHAGSGTNLEATPPAP